MCGVSLVNREARWAVDPKDSSRWTVLGECPVHGVIGARVGDELENARPMGDMILMDSDEFYAGAIGGKAVLWPHHRRDLPPDGGVREPRRPAPSADYESGTRSRS